jgi:multiple sugar transport system permease protein
VVGVWFYAALLVLPIYYIVISSSKTNEEIFSRPTALPKNWSGDNFSKAWEMAALGDGLINSGIIVMASLLITLVLSIPAAYSIARSGGRLSRAVELFFAGGFLIPTFAALVATVLLSIAVGLFQTKLFLILYYPATALPLAVILLTQYMRSIPAELAESAMIDGASRLKVLMLIYLPLSWPAISSVLVVNFIQFWNEYLFALIIAGPSIETRTAQVALPTLAGLKMTDYGLMSAGTVIILIPVFVFYAILQKRLEGALAAGALKG